MAKLICALDAGHGANTAGKRSPDSSLMEYEFNRDVAKRVKALLEAAGVEVVLTADTLDDVPLSTRVAIANKANATIFVSLHANAYGTDWNDVSGWEIYCSKGSEKGARLAEAIHSESKVLGLKDRGVKTTSEFYVVVKTKMPAVLIEHGFYTNKAECEKLKSGDFRQQCAVADAKGILKYLGIAWPAATPAATVDYKALWETEKAKVDAIKKIVG